MDCSYPLIRAELRRCLKTGIILGDLQFKDEHGHKLAVCEDVMVVYEKDKLGIVVEAFMTDGEWGISTETDDFERLEEAAKLYGSNKPDWWSEDGNEVDRLVLEVRKFLEGEKKRRVDDLSWVCR